MTSQETRRRKDLAADPPGAFGRIRLESWAFSDDPDVLVGQYSNLKRQVPLLYVLLMIIAVAGFYLMKDAAPVLLVGGVSLLFVIVGAIRLVYWVWLLPSPDEIPVERARALLRRTTLAVIPICIAYLGYAFMLEQFGDPSHRAGVTICLVLAAIGCIFCLMHLPQAAMTVNLTTMVPYAAYQAIMGNETFVLVALIAGVVTTLMIRVSLNAHEDFVELITSRAELAVRRGEAERLAAENARLAHTDALTGMPNRRLFLARLEERVEDCTRSGRRFVVGILDLDRFKPVNDIHGHATGDQLLVEVGQRLQSLADDRLLVARLGGDEFGLLLDDDVAAARRIGARIVALLREPFQIEGNGVALGCSIGFASFPEAGRSASAIFDRADYALYDVKADRRRDFAFFTPDLERRLRAESELEAALLSADFAGELQVELQPIVHLDSGRVCSLEALARWDSAAIGAVEPTRFIEAAERLNLMGSITTTLFGKSLAALAALPEGLGLSFNLSTRDIVTSTTIDMLIAAIAEHGIAPARLTFEITETALMQDYDTAIAHVERLRALGAAIALDDFGTGYSSLSYFSRLPIDTIKIDRGFVSSLAEPGVRKIVTAILGMCETLQVACIAEGVESAQESTTLRHMGCTMAQGYAIARPMALADLADWLARQPCQTGSAAFVHDRQLRPPALAGRHGRPRRPARAG